MNNGKFELLYFKINGRAAIIRAILSYVKADWKDNSFEQKDWPEIKTSGKCEFGQVPILFHNGKSYSQTLAICIYLAKIFNIYGKDIKEQYQIDSLLCSNDDITPLIYPIILPKTEEEKKNIEQSLENFREKFSRYLEIYEKRYLALGAGKYYLGDHFSLADIFLTTFLIDLSSIYKKENLIKKHSPKIFELIERVKANELKEFFEKYHF